MATTLTISPLSATIEVGGTVQLTTVPANGVKWSCSNCGVVFVSGTGLVKGLRQGTSIVRARRGNLTASSTITVGAALPIHLPPVAVLTVVSSAPARSVVSFDTTASSDPDGTLASGSVNPGDGSAPLTWLGLPPPPAALSYSYQQEGTYTITLTVTDNDGLSSVVTRQILVTPPTPPTDPPPPPANQAPLAVLAFVSGQLTGQPVLFSTVGTRDPDGTIANYSVDFGDGTTIGPLPGTPPLQLNNTYTTPGTYSPRLTVTDSQGLQGTAQTTIQVQAPPPPPTNLPPVASIQWTGGVLAGDDFIFDTRGSVDPDGTIGSSVVNFGDGTVLPFAGTPPYPLAHQYLTAGAKVVALTVTDLQGASATQTITVSVAAVPVPAPAGLNWASFYATYVLELYKTAGEEITDITWFHLHEGHAEAESFTMGLRAWSENTNLPNRRNIPLADLPAGHQVRFEVRGTPITDWMNITAAPGTTITLAQVAALGIQTGIHDLSLRVQGPQFGNFQPIPSFLHVFRIGVPAMSTVPIISRNDQMLLGFSDYPQDGARTGPGIVYVNVNDRAFSAKPVATNVVAWTEPPYAADLYVEEMQPHANLFMPMQMWWQEPPGTVSAGLKFVRAIPPKFHGEDARILYSEGFGGGQPTDQFGYQGQRTFPYKDGGRGVAWTSPFITGQVDSTGGFAFVEAGGPLRYMKADGEILTVAGWVTDPTKDPVWMLKPLDLIRQNQVLKGTWSNGQYANNSGFRLPLDVAIDPLNENIWYVVGFYDHCIWKVVTNADRTTATVSVFAGDVNHDFGYTDATGTAARFNGPCSLVFDPVADCLYVADQNNDCIRKITRAGVVTTLFGTTNFGATLQGRGATNVVVESTYISQTESLDRTQNRALSQFLVNATQAGMGVKPEIYMPYTIRVFSNGDLCVVDLGFGSIRRIKVSGETTLVSLFSSNFIAYGRYWVWIDVDRWGNSGPIDGVYFCNAVASQVAGEPDAHTNEVFAWLPGDGSAPMKWIAGPDLDFNPDGWGPRSNVDLPHYPWLVAVDPRGGLFMAGIGEHGICRMRKRRVNDPIPSNYPNYFAGKLLWLKLGSDVGGDYSVGHPTPIIQFGSECHNMLGFADAWGLTGATDQQLLDAFGIPAAVQANPSDRATIVNFIRLNAGPV